MEALKELMISTLHSKFDDFPYMMMYEGMEMKLVHARPDEKLMVVQIRAHPFCKSGLHKHLGFTFGLTTRGAWSHSPSKFPYQPHSYVCEPVNELHRFHNGPDITEAYYINIGDQEYYDDEGREAVRRSNAGTTLKRYLEMCEAAGVPRPNIPS